MNKPSIDLIRSGVILEKFTSSSGLELDWKLDIDKLHLSASYRACPLVEALQDITPSPIRNQLSIAGIDRGGYILTLFNRAFSGILKVNKDNTIEIERPIGNWECILWEDVVTTGASITRAIKALSKHGIKVIQTICILDRRKEFLGQIHTDMIGYHPIANHYLKIDSLFTTADLEEARLVPDYTSVKGG